MTTFALVMLAVQLSAAVGLYYYSTHRPQLKLTALAIGFGLVPVPVIILAAPYVAGACFNIGLRQEASITVRPRQTAKLQPFRGVMIFENPSDQDVTFKAQIDPLTGYKHYLRMFLEVGLVEEFLKLLSVSAFVWVFLRRWTTPTQEVGPIICTAIVICASFGVVEVLSNRYLGDETESQVSFAPFGHALVSFAWIFALAKMLSSWKIKLRHGSLLAAGLIYSAWVHCLWNILHATWEWPELILVFTALTMPPLVLLAYWRYSHRILW